MSGAWWRDQVVYQVYPRSFADADGDGIGDLRGILEHVDHLADLGVGVVWLSPVYASPQDDNGYDISDYQAIDPVFGTLEDLDALVAALHERGIRLVMDLVVNHTSDEHAWFVESRSSRTSDKRDWYWWAPPRPGHVGGEPGAEPTNWVSFFSGPAWEWDEASGEYFLHLFSRKQPDLNWENPQVRSAVHAMMRWWLDRGVDGFRMDVIDMISKTVGPDGHLPDGVPGSAGTAEPTLADGSAAFITGPRLHEFLHEMHEEVFAGREHPVLTVGECPGITVEEAVLATDPQRREVDMVFQFEHVDLDHGDGKWDHRPLALPVLKASLARWQEGLADAGWNSLYWDNHDQPRAVSRFGDDGPAHRVASAKTLATVLHLHRGTPYVYQGEELGMANVPFERIEDYRDIESRGHYRAAVAAGQDPADVLVALRRTSRDNARTPMPWDGSPTAGFTTGTPWIGVNPENVTVNVAAQQGDDDSVLAHYRRLIRLRKEEPAVVEGRFALLLPDHEQVWAFTRTTPVTELLVIANCSSQEAQVQLDLTGWTPYDALVPSHGDGPADVGTLRPWESVVLRRRLS
ncbi:glycoside hydrolase family 13 protein [Lapillicoccus jejuensis]|uniref:Oligo-1,6-glucosidase n=1 Tax=Lapillicoccus jejuensis TaxID=402171 RepID=A0A542DWE7_9MICO|nr:alpha-glucosidase [Lapillicoccus jejuensis]TQJ07417.1 oligo-1,6-glucosidase [Lapillicoccus jejuensis]